MNSIPITVVRLSEVEARAALERYVFGGLSSGPRVPRGIDPALVSNFIRERLTPSSDPGVYTKTLEVMRFYERADVLPHILLALSGHESSPEDLLRSSVALQAIGDFGSEAQIAQGAQYFDRVLLPHPMAPQAFGTLFQSVIALSAASSAEKLGQRLAQQVDEAASVQNQGQQQRNTYLKLAAVQRNDLPRNKMILTGKLRLLGLSQAERRQELVELYLQESPLNTPQMETWSARMLRFEAMHGDPSPVYAGFARAVDLADPETLGEQRAEFIIRRAAQAILYLQGELTQQQRALYEKTPSGPASFLWDDL